MAKIALFPGSFDPFTKGHLDTVQRASQLFDQVIIAVMTNAAKQPLFDSPTKVALIAEVTTDLPNVQVVAQPKTLTADFARQVGARYLIRGIRNANDFEYERDIAALNQTQDDQLETVLLLAKQEYAFISSSMVKEIASFGGQVSQLVPPAVERALKQKLQDKRD
ncbi:pantetheine-phosphate adenylyltransferase [Latilactobacillus fuchuensis]|uniref:Phosphopantetheine adenylyltransferase n=1 Tax=Latilactobacillus fuchuensis DSM 14340 = JCM 11249 TaxID=1423747 RepID=A0A0R1RNJ6_9LACO|nr:pantetheine-phosphate adenylyltransferase [Latilactobacillus fuchuensis]KRL58460.1 coaD protein [Latilactobacillus fuchuensis DSM 14340 = JCM 11249]MCP8857698.1 pantetheine-phosphate adenylyltransferase [Latilactobacillus fuchuensis]